MIPEFWSHIIPLKTFHNFKQSAQMRGSLLKVYVKKLNLLLAREWNAAGGRQAEFANSVLCSFIQNSTYPTPSDLLP